MSAVDNFKLLAKLQVSEGNPHFTFPLIQFVRHQVPIERLKALI
jgi:hypothetical protein